MKRRIASAACLAAFAIGLTACGGSNGSVYSARPSPPAPAAAPLGLTQQSSFETTALVYRHGSEDQPQRTADVEFRYSAGDGAYELKVPDLPAGRLRGSSGGPGDFVTTNFESSDSSGAARTVHVELLKPGDANRHIVLSYTSMGSWLVDGQAEPKHNGYFAYGVPTPPSEVPVSGTGEYSARIFGSGTGYGRVTGDARLEFDFGAGKLAGEMRPVLEDPTGLGFNSAALGTYKFTDTVFARGSTSFSGSFIVPGATASSWFEGSFTGPGAAELMARWQAPFVHPDGFAGTIFGVWVGKRQ